MQTFCCVLALFAICFAQTPEPCQSPQQWQGRRLLIDPSKGFSEYSRIFYDETNMRERVIEEIDAGREKDYYDTLTLYNERKEYRVNLRTKQCNVTTVTHPFRVKGVPPGSKFFSEGVIGAASLPLEHFTAVTFTGDFPEDHVRYASTVTYPDCVPVTDRYYNDVTKFVQSWYFDIHAGISDPEAFIPPQLCMQN